MAAKLSGLSAGFKGYYQQALGGAVGFGAPNATYNPTSMGTSVDAVGIISSPIEFNMNPTTVQLYTGVTRLPYNEITTRANPQLTFMIDQLSVWNIAFGGMGLEQSAVSGSSVLNIDMLYIKNDGTLNPSDLTGHAVAQRGFAACELLTQSPNTDGSGAPGTLAFQFWKTGAFSNGAMTFGGEAITQIPVRVQIFGNDSDKAGQVVSSVTHTKPAYEA